MTRKLFHFGLLLLVVITTAVTFAVTRSLGHSDTESGYTSLWLCLSKTQCQQIHQQDPGFKEQAQALVQSLQAHQQALIQNIRDPNTPNEQIRSQAQRVVDTHHDLMRRVVQHLLVVRRYADPQQCLRLNGLCANALTGNGMQARHSQMQHRGERGPHGARGGPGHGMGMGRQYRRGRLAPALAITEAQQAEVLQLDPTFETDVVELTESLRTRHIQFTQHLADPNVSDSMIHSLLEDLIDARTRLEQRTAEHILRLRPLLSPEQQECLIGLSQRGCRWREGRGSEHYE